MATSDGLPPDPLTLLRGCVATNSLPIPAPSDDPSTAIDTTLSLALATHLIFNTESIQDGAQHIAMPLSQITRFVSVAAGNRALDLRSVFFCWQNKDQSAGSYIAATQALNEELRSDGKQETVTNLVFAEKLDLNQWLAGEVGEEESEFIRSLDANKATRAEAKDAAATAAGGEDVEMRDADLADGAAAKREQERLREIFAAERKMGDRNLMLRGVKIQDFSDVRKKYSVLFFGKSRGPPGAQPAPTLTNNPALRPPVKAAQPGRRPEPIILLSPSASSLLRMPNIKSFLEEGVYTPPESGTTSNILHLTRTIPHLAASKPIRFILVDDPSTFRPDYWERLVAVFTTGQTWQFKNYKWQQPADLFSHALGIYVGWKGEIVPDSVKGWGRGVMVAQIDKGKDRWRDREVVEEVWRNIEGRMKEMGWAF
ncbi:accessory factor associated with RNA polymerase II [Recurvomyces mirabilis]|nr:accessory factor associated with RNA polymerase II [Recurvomyces mirabilis]